LGVALVLAAGLLVVLGGGGGCDVNLGCDECHSAVGAQFNFACPTDLTSVVASSPCSLSDASLEQFKGLNSFGVESPSSTGTCHVELTCATGFVYSADVTFTSQSGGCPGCGTTIGPTQGPIMVNNPSSTCVVVPDAGAEAGASDAADAGAE
jgi:hypothetical protein